MKKQCILSTLLAGAFAGIGAMVWSGCEADSASQAVTITPQSVVVKKGQSVQFQASGGYDYKWSLSPNDGSGILNTKVGSTVIYTCIATNIGTYPKQIKVVSTIEGTSSGGTSNSTPYSVEATADIYYATPLASTSTSTNSP